MPRTSPPSAGENGFTWILRPATVRGVSTLCSNASLLGQPILARHRQHRRRCPMLDSRAMPSTLTHLECSRPNCGHVLDYSSPHNLCPVCHGPLFARYDLATARRTLTRSALAARPNLMWRYEEVMPATTPVTLGEGMTPLLPARRLGEHVGLDRLYIKEEGQNPTASFKARGLSAAVSMAKTLGVSTIALPTAGNAGGAAATYAA